MTTADETTEIRQMTGGEALVQSLIDNDVDTVFGIPGIQLDPLYDAFFKERNRVRLIHTRHEQGAAFMAMGYAQASGRVGTFAVVPGPGLLNAMAAVSTAVAANAPVLGITGQIPSNQIGLGLGMAHELDDQLAMSRAVVRWAERADHPAEIPALVRDAFEHMLGHRPKPAIFEMAPDRYAMSAPVRAVPRAEPVAGPPLDTAAVERIAARLAGAERPAIFVGGGIFDATGPLRALAERLNAPVIESPNGRGAIPGDHPLYFNLLEGQLIWDHVDVALVVGSRFTATAMAWGRENDVDVLRIDVDPRQIDIPRRPDVALLASAAEGLQAVLEALGDGHPPERENFLTACAGARAEMTERLGQLGMLPELSRAIRKVLPRDGILVADVTQIGSFTRYSMPVYTPRSLLSTGYQATLGYALPAAIGAKVACPDRAVVAVCGDGGFMFTVQELATAVHHRIPIVVIVLDNASYGNVKTIQAQSFGARHIGVDLSNPDFVAMAKSYGMNAEEAPDGAALEASLERLLKAGEPALIKVPIGQVPPIWDLVKRPPSQGRV